MKVEAELFETIVNRKPMIRLLRRLDKEGGELATRRLLECFNGNDLHSQLLEAERLGFIERNVVPQPKGEKGNRRVVNVLTEKGRRLLRLAAQFIIT